MRNILLVSLGGAFGSALRYLTNLALQNLTLNFPLATFSVNILGSFLIGILACFVDLNFLSENNKLLLISGFLGAFTTFSSFSLEINYMLKNNQTLLALLYISSSLALCILATHLGFKVANNFVN